VVVYPATEEGVNRAVESARGADLIVKASGVGVFDEFLEAAIPSLKTTSGLVAFWDVDAPGTFDRLRRDPADPFASQIPKYDILFTYGGGPPVVTAYESFGARTCVPIYNALDPQTHFPVDAEDRFKGALGFLGNRLPDREARVEEFFLRPATDLPQLRFLLGGSGWDDKARSPNIKYFDHVYTRDHNAFNCSPLAVLNISRESMAVTGHSPATRVFEAAGASACLITDAREGIEVFFEPGCEVLVASDGLEVTELLLKLTPQRARQIGEAAWRRALSEHTYTHRAATVEAVLEGEAVLGGPS
jgi:spore maturation protein CgeB